VKTVLAASGDSGFFGTLHDFFDSGSWPLLRNLAIFMVVVFWLAVGYWVFKDARRRIADPWLVGAATILGLVPPFVGAFIYMLFRPPEYLEDVRERELEIKAMEESLGRGRHQNCPVCRADIDETFLVCPVCTTRLRQACVNCKAPLKPLWQVVPTARRRSSRRRRSTFLRSKPRGRKPGPSRVAADGGRAHTRPDQA